MGVLFGRTEKKETPVGKGKVIAFLNQKGGVGKTTMAFNTAHALRVQGKRVLCIDMDPQANLSLLLGVELGPEDSGIYSLLINSVRELKALHRPVMITEVTQQSDGVDVIASGQDLSGFELTVAGINAPRQLLLKKFIEKNGLLALYDYIIVDCPPTLGLLVVNVLCACHGVIIPFRPDEFSRKGMGHFYHMLEDIEEMGVSEIPEILAHIPNLVDIRRKQESDDLDRISSELAEEFSGARITLPFYNRSQLVKSQAQRKSVFGYQSKEFKELQGQFNNIADIIQEWNVDVIQ